jgi:hypothetical protein
MCILCLCLLIVVGTTDVGIMALYVLMFRKLLKNRKVDCRRFLLAFSAFALVVLSMTIVGMAIAVMSVVVNR